MNRSLTRLCLVAAIAMPILYFGTQLVAAPFYPGYSFSNQVASMLGTQFSLHPWIFNSGAILTGVAAIVGGFGFYGALHARTYARLSWLIALSVAITGFVSIKAGLFPLPDHRHASWGFLLAFAIITLPLMLGAVWKQRDLRPLRAYLIAAVAYLVLLVPVMSRIIPLPFLHAGAAQRLFAIAIFVPIGVAGYFLRRAL
jgi:hypothetical membrane protein